MLAVFNQPYLLGEESCQAAHRLVFTLTWQLTIVSA